MNKIPVKIVKWMANVLGYDIVMVKMSGDKPLIEGNDQLVKHVDIFNFSRDKLVRRRFKIR